MYSRIFIIFSVHKDILLAQTTFLETPKVYDIVCNKGIIRQRRVTYLVDTVTLNAPWPIFNNERNENDCTL